MMVVQLGWYQPLILLTMKMGMPLVKQLVEISDRMDNRDREQYAIT
jgi:hypothetical protein